MSYPISWFPRHLNMIMAHFRTVGPECTWRGAVPGSGRFPVHGVPCRAGVLCRRPSGTALGAAWLWRSCAPSSTRCVIWEHSEAGETVDDIAADFGLSEDDVRWAVAYETSARARAA